MQLFVFAVACNVFSCQLKHSCPPSVLYRDVNRYIRDANTSILSCQWFCVVHSTIILFMQFMNMTIGLECISSSWIWIESTIASKITHHLRISIWNALNLNWNSPASQSHSRRVCVCLQSHILSLLFISLVFFLLSFLSNYWQEQLFRIAAFSHYVDLCFCISIELNKWNWFRFSLRNNANNRISSANHKKKWNQNESEKSREKNAGIISFQLVIWFRNRVKDCKRLLFCISFFLISLIRWSNAISHSHFCFERDYNPICAAERFNCEFVRFIHLPRALSLYIANSSFLFYATECNQRQQMNARFTIELQNCIFCRWAVCALESSCFFLNLSSAGAAVDVAALNEFDR